MYNVGDIVYSTIPESGKIVPLQIIEISIIKKIDSEETQYKVKLPTRAEKIYNLNKFPKVFTAMPEIQEYLLSNAKNAIEQMVFEAEDLEQKHFAKIQQVERINQEENIVCKSEPEYVKIDLGDGQVGKIKPDYIHKEINEHSEEEGFDSWRI